MNQDNRYADGINGIERASVGQTDEGGVVMKGGKQ